LTLKSGEDTTINGSQAKGEKVVADIGGDLNIASQQDTGDYTAKNKNSGIGFSTGTKGGRTGSIGKGKTDSTYASVTEQAGIYAGEDGFDIHVGKNTDLKGAVISSDATLDKNKISTDTLTYSDIQNKADYSSSGFGINYSSKPGEKGSGIAQGITPNVTPSVNGDADSTTHSAISPGTIIVGGVRVDPNISRDPSGSLNALGKIFDKKTVQEQQELSSLFGQMAYEAVGNIAREHQMEAGKKNYDAAMLEKLDPNNPQIAILRQEASGILDEWGQGGTSKIALHALVGGMMSNLSGNSFGVGATAEGLNEALQKGLGAWEEKHPGMNQWASLVIGGAVGGLTGGNPTTTGSVTLSGTKYNADVPRVLLGLSPMIPDAWIDNVFNPGLKMIFKKVGTGGLDPNQYKCFAVDAGEGVSVRFGYIIDGTGNVFEVTGAGVGASILPVSVGGTIGIVLDKNGKRYDRDDMKDAMNGYSVGFSFQGGTQGGISWSPSGTWYGEVGVVANAGVGGAVTKTNYLFNIND
jgi:hypothetical protein